METLPVAVVGGGPAGLMAAEVLSERGVPVHVFDAMPSPGRKFLLAGRGGLNITHSEAFECFLSRYGSSRAWLEPMIRAFDPETLRNWIHGLGVETFVGTSGRVFPAEMKAAPLLRHWLQRLRAAGVQIHVRHRWQGIQACEGEWLLSFQTPEGVRQVRSTAVVLALGGGSWARLGSDGAWVPMLREAGVEVHALQASNCGFDTAWSPHFCERHAGEALKNVAASVEDGSGCRVGYRRGECMVTASGLEGGLIYALGSHLREALLQRGSAILRLDLMPDRSEDWLQQQIAHGRGTRSMASHLQSRLGLKGVKAGLLREYLGADGYTDAARVAAAIKSLPVVFHATRPIDEAISTAGGVSQQAVDECLMLRNLPGVFCAGEMLDWDAPTGGYLLTACVATGRAAAQGALAWMAGPGVRPAAPAAP